MFTNGMVETSSSDIYFKDVSAEAFLVMLQFMYTGVLDIDILETGPILILLLLLADQFGVTVLQQECCKRVIECLSEVVYPIFLMWLYIYFVFLSFPFKLFFK